jgi:diketogulonate reductase-like aldo/keto reductase
MEHRRPMRDPQQRGRLPALGLGVFQTPPDETRDAVRAALDAGYRNIDTAAAYDAYRALETLLADGRVRAIGVSNFMVDRLATLLDRASVVPAVNQIEVHPYFVQPEVQAFGTEHALQDPVIGGVATAHGETPAQVMLRWGIQHGRSVIPTSIKPNRIAENIDVFDFELTSDEMAAIDALDSGRRGGPEPDAITLEAVGREIPEA